MNKYQEALNNLKTYAVDYIDTDCGAVADVYLYEYYKKEFDLLQKLVDAWEVIKNTFEIGVDEQIDEIYIKGKNYYGNEKTVWGHSKEGASKVKQAIEV